MASLSGLKDAVALQFPVGRTRLETVAVIVCAVIMSIATVLVIRESIGALIDGLAHRELPNPLHFPKVQLAAVTRGHPEVFRQKATAHHLQCQLSCARFASCVICARCVQEAAHAM